MHVIVTGEVPIRPDAAEAFARAAADMARAARAEPGCLVYVMAIDPLDPSIVSIFEVWRDIASFTGYAGSDYATTYARRTADLRAGPTQVTLLTGSLRYSGAAPAIADLERVLSYDEEGSG